MDAMIALPAELTLLAPIELDEPAVAARLERYRAALPGARVRLRNLPDAGRLPRRLDTAAAIAEVSDAVAPLIADSPGGEVMADCMLDPGAETSPAPGLFGLLARALAADGETVVVASRNAAMRDRMAWLVEHYGVGETCAEALDLRIGPERAFDAEAWTAAIAGLRERGETRPVLACCTGVEFAEAVRERLAILTPYDVLRRVAIRTADD